MISSKGQSAIEFMVLIGFLLLGFVIFLTIVKDNLQEKTNDLQNLKVKEIALIVKEEVELASASREGYLRNFTIPQDVYGDNYIFIFADNSISVGTSDLDHAISFALPNVTGTLQKGENIIQKKNGLVILNG